jgi:hypothetical protein
MTIYYHHYRDREYITPRDSQRSKLYQAEAAAFGYAPAESKVLDLEAIKARAEGVLRSAWVRKHFPSATTTVLVYHRHHRARSTARCSGDRERARRNRGPRSRVKACHPCASHEGAAAQLKRPRGAEEDAMLRITPEAWHLSNACEVGIEEYRKKYPDGEPITPETLCRWHIRHGLHYLHYLLTNHARDRVYQFLYRLNRDLSWLLGLQPKEYHEDAQTLHASVQQTLADFRSFYAEISDLCSKLNSYRPEVWPYLIIDK